MAIEPTYGVKPPRRHQSTRGYLTIPQVEAVAVEAMRVRAVYATVVGFLAYTGLRWGEMAALRVENFDMLRRRVQITEAVSEGAREARVGNAEGSRTAFRSLPAFLAQPLAELMEGKGRSDLVFTGAKGAVLAVSRFRPRVFAPAVSRAQKADSTFPTITS